MGAVSLTCTWRRVETIIKIYYACLGFQQHTRSKVKLVWNHLLIIVYMGSPCFVCSLSKLGLPLNFVAGVELYFVEEAENKPAFML